jgi:hypothetical protein
MKDAVFVHVVYRSEHLVHEVTDSVLWQVVPSAFYRLIHIHIHQLKYKSQSPSRLIAKD